MREDFGLTGGGVSTGKFAVYQKLIWTAAFSDGDIGEMDQAELEGGLGD